MTDFKIMTYLKIKNSTLEEGCRIDQPKYRNAKNVRERMCTIDWRNLMTCLKIITYDWSQYND